MNLTTGKWIPVVWADGRYDKVSLLDVFEQGDQISDLAVRPHERIALMRLLICIAQAALDGPADYDEWKACLPKLAPAATNYLNKWKAAFELFGDGPRFLQVAALEKGMAKEDDVAYVAKLDIQLAAGSTTTLFDNSGSGERSFGPDELALILISFQNFSPGGTLSITSWNGIKTKLAGNKPGPSIAGRMLHAFRWSSTSLRKTIWLNMVTKEQAEMHDTSWGLPIWEKMPQAPDDKNAENNAIQTYMGRLVPLSRFVKLDSDRIHVNWGAGFQYPPFGEEGCADPFATIYRVKTKFKNDALALLNVSPGKAIWRDLHAITVIRKDENSIGGPWVLCNHTGEKFELYAAGVAYDPQNIAKLIGIYDSRYHVPAVMYEDQDRNRLYRTGVALADGWSSRIKSAIEFYKKKMDLAMVSFSNAAAHYWTAVEQSVPDLFAITANPHELFPDGATQPNWSATCWGRALARHAREAYDLACPRQTPRQLQAYVEGLKSLFEAQPTSTPTEESDHE